jgi:hypothetical protein
MNNDEVKQQEPEILESVKQLLEERIDQRRGEQESSMPPPKDVLTETHRNTLYDEDTPTSATVYAWSMGLPNLGEVVVTDLEKAKYLKAVLNDVPVILPISLEMGDDEAGNIVVDLRTLSNYEMDVAFFAIQEDGKENRITGTAQMAGRLQQYAGAMQTVKFQNDMFNHIEFPDPGEAKKDAIKLRDFTNKHISCMQWPRWQAILNALRIFETKIKICNDAALNGNFWTPQDADS